jgi:CBS domain containing-hemolysin-like protein
VLTLTLMSVSALSRVALHRVATENGRGLEFLQHLKTPSSTHRIAAHMARQLCLLGLLLVTAGAAIRLGWPYPWLTSVALLAFAVVFVMDSLLARILAVRYPRAILRRVGPVLRVIRIPLLPAANLAAAVVRRAGEVSSRSEEDREEEQDEEVEAYFEVGEREGILEADEGKMMRSIVDLGDTLVREIMTPRPDIQAIPFESTVGQARDAMQRAAHSKMPVYRDGTENIVGVLHLRDLVQAWADDRTEAPIAEFVRPPFYVPETQKVDDLLDRLRTGTAIALVVDEYGGIAGLVTLEDVLEEIVGDIRDEHDEEEDMMREQPDGSWLLSGLVHVESLEELFGVELEIVDRDFDTVGGLVVSVLGRVPVAGEEFLHGALRVRVVEADARRVFQVEVARAETADEAPGDPTVTS